MTKQILILTILIGSLTVTLFGQTPEYKQYLFKQNIPDPYRGMVSSQLGDQFELSDFMNPFYLLADFNGGKQTDIVVTIKEVSTGKVGLMVVHGETENSFVLGAGKNFGNGGDDFNWLDIWRVYTEELLEAGVGETESINLTTVAIFVEKAESASAVIYWTGTEYKWYQQGD